MSALPEQRRVGARSGRMTPEEILAEEAAGRQRAGFAALAAALLTILGVS